MPNPECDLWLLKIPDSVVKKAGVSELRGGGGAGRSNQESQEQRAMIYLPALFVHVCVCAFTQCLMDSEMEGKSTEASPYSNLHLLLLLSVTHSSTAVMYFCL